MGERGDLACRWRSGAGRGADPLGAQLGAVRAVAVRDHRGRGTGNASADDRNLSSANAGNSGKQNSFSTFTLLKITGSDLGGHSSGHFAHGSEKGKSAVIELDGFVSNSFYFALHQLLGELRLSSEVEVSVENQVFIALFIQVFKKPIFLLLIRL